MTTFEKIHRDVILGKLTAFDRIIFRGCLNRLMPDGAFQRFMSANGVLLKDFSSFVQAATEELKAHAQRVAEQAGRPFIYLDQASTKARFLFPDAIGTSAGRGRVCQRVSRLIRHIRDRGLLTKVKKRRLYRVSPLGYRLMTAAITLRTESVPAAFSGIAA